MFLTEGLSSAASYITPGLAGMGSLPTIRQLGNHYLMHSRNVNGGSENSVG
jgi:hypothetical protein